MARAGWSMALLALVVTALSALIPLIGTFIIGPLATIIIGAGAGWWASKRLGSGGAGRGAGAGAIAGLGAFIGATIGTVIIFSILSGSPDGRAQISSILAQMQQEDPTLNQLSSDDLASAISVLGGGLGFCVGLFNIFLAMIGGLIAGLVYGKRDTPPAVAAAPVGAYDNATLPQMSGQPTYPEQQSYGTQPTSSGQQNYGNQTTYGEPQNYGTQPTYGNQSPYTGQTQMAQPPSAEPAPPNPDEFKTRVFDPTARNNDDDQHKTRIYDDRDRS